jgi:hypothetical protein
MLHWKVCDNFAYVLCNNKRDIAAAIATGAHAGDFLLQVGKHLLLSRAPACAIFRVDPSIAFRNVIVNSITTKFAQTFCCRIEGYNRSRFGAADLIQIKK